MLCFRNADHNKYGDKGMTDSFIRKCATMMVQILVLIGLSNISVSGQQPPGPGPGGPGQQGDGIWVRNAYFGEIQTFDKCFGHQPGNGIYHHHVQPVCLRAQLNDNLEVVRSGRTGTTYREKSSSWVHSPILGWSFDGYPIYGPYGYSDPTSAASSIRRIRSGFRVRSITARNSLPDWALAHHAGVSQQLTSTQYGPAISDSFPVGRYVEDFEYVQGIGDLDQYNGRFTVTPDFPGGTYAYFVTIDENGAPAFPYILGLQYNGAMTGSFNAAAPVNAQTYFTNGAYQQSTGSVPQLSSWFTKNSLEYAKVVSGFDPAAGPVTVWPFSVPAGAQASGSVTTPTTADPQSISATDTAVYVRSNNLASYTMGPWFVDGANGGVFPNFPSAQTFQVRIPRTPAATTSRTNTGLGPVGMWVNGVAVFNVLDGSSYSNAQMNDLGGGPVRPGVMQTSAASYEGGPVAPGSLISAFSLFSAKLATATAAAPTPDWPVTLAGATVTVRDSTGATIPAQISYASPGQINYRLPETVATGLATVTISSGGSSVSGAINVVATYPNIFMLNNEGLAAAQVVRARNGSVTYENVFQVSGNSIVPQPIDLGPASDEVYLVLYGSGLGRTNPSVTVKIDGVEAAVVFSGAQGIYAGLDQFNVRIPASLAGRGRVAVVLTAGDKPSNTVFVTIR